MCRVSAFFLTVALATCAISSVSAQIPRVISYQGVVQSDLESGQSVRYNVTFRLYDSENRSTPVYEELKLVDASNGLISTVIGPIRQSVPFDRRLWLTVQVDRGPESERTPLCVAPYAVRAEIANRLSPDAPDVVRSVNGQSGDVEVECNADDLLERIEDLEKMLSELQRRVRE